MLVDFVSVATADLQQSGACPGADTSVIWIIFCIRSSGSCLLLSRMFPPKLESLVPGEWYHNRCDHVFPNVSLFPICLFVCFRHIARRVVKATWCGGEQHLEFFTCNSQLCSIVVLSTIFVCY